MALARVLGDYINAHLDVVYPHLCSLWWTVDLSFCYCYPNKQVRNKYDLYSCNALSRQSIVAETLASCYEGEIYFPGSKMHSGLSACGNHC